MINCKNITTIDMDEVIDKLKYVECPFNWNLNEIRDRKPADFILGRLSEKEEEIAESWVHVCISLTMAYLHTENHDNFKALELMKKCDRILNTSDDYLILKYKSALDTVVNASRVYILTKMSTPNEVRQYSDRIVKLQELNQVNQAAVSAIKANVFSEFGVSGSTKALEYAKEALQKNCDEADWYFLMGKLLSRIRHFKQEHEISQNELFNFQKAFQLKDTPRYAIFLANTYIDKSKSLFFARCYGQINELSENAKNLIEFALEKNNKQCVHITTRCAKALSKLPRRLKDIARAQKLTEESLKRSPLNPTANKLAGDLCLLDKKPNFHNALRHYEAAASRNVYSANFSAFDIQVQLKLSQDPERFYNKMMEKFTEKNYQCLTLIHAVEYYLFKRRDLCLSVVYFLQAIAIDKDFHAFTDRYVKCIRKNINYYKLMMNEVRSAINSQVYNSEQMNILKKLVSTIRETKPELMQAPVIPNKVQSYLDSVVNEDLFGRGRGRKRGRDNDTRGEGRVEVVKTEDTSDKTELDIFSSKDRNTKKEDIHINEKSSKDKSHYRSSSVSSSEWEVVDKKNKTSSECKEEYPSKKVGVSFMRMTPEQEKEREQGPSLSPADHPHTSTIG